jgi:signal transduction histidine kinase
VRLWVALLLAILAVAGAWFVIEARQMSQRETGTWDASLRDTGQLILLSMPADIGKLAAGKMLALPATTVFRGDRISYQVWVDRRAVVVHSPGAPNAAFNANFNDGFSTSRLDGAVWRVFAVTDRTGHVQVQVAKQRDALDSDIERWARLSVVTALASFVLLAAAIGMVVRWSFRPVAALRAAIAKRKPFDLTPLSGAGLPNELQPLIAGFNRVLEQLDDAVQAERRFIADAAHELRTPLAALLMQAQIALRATEPVQRREALERLTAGAQRSARLTEQLLDLARLEAGDRTARMSRVDLHELIVVTLRDFEVTAHQKRQTISLDGQPCPILGETDELGILIRNLIDNAVRYTGTGGRIQIGCRRTVHASEPAVKFSISDDGPGVPAGERDRIFERFFRGAGQCERGSGIGLSLVARIAEMHGASIEVGPGIDGEGLGIAISFVDGATSPAIDEDEHRMVRATSR